MESRSLRHVIECMYIAEVLLLIFPVGGWGGRVPMGGVDGGCRVFVFLCFGFVELDIGPSFNSFRGSSSVSVCVWVCVEWGGGEVFSFANCDVVCACPAGGVGADDD